MSSTVLMVSTPRSAPWELSERRKAVGERSWRALGTETLRADCDAARDVEARRGETGSAEPLAARRARCERLWAWSDDRGGRESLGVLGTTSRVLALGSGCDACCGCKSRGCLISVSPRPGPCIADSAPGPSATWSVAKGCACRSRYPGVMCPLTGGRQKDRLAGPGPDAWCRKTSLSLKLLAFRFRNRAKRPSLVAFAIWAC